MKKMILSPKQMRLLRWWQEGYDAVFCDGAIRSGKTLVMGLSFFLWAMEQFRGCRFGLCGKTIESLRRNLLAEVEPKLRAMGFEFRERRSENLLIVNFRGRENSFYLFGGKDESAAGLIQGITLAGVLLDEAALMPRSFVEQACARCSLPGSKLWFNCNPAGPGHWLYQQWVLQAREKNCLRLHFTMEDNPSLSLEIRQRYERLYTGVFYQRFVLGRWVQAEGRVYDFFHNGMVGEIPERCREYYISCDYGTVNPCSMGLWGKSGGRWYRIGEYYFDSRREQRQKTDAEYAQALENLAGGREIRAVIVDPSAASFLELLRRQGWRVKKARNEVLSGIRQTADALKNEKIVICQNCRDCLREMEEYVWEGKGEAVRKENDHAMDDMRYFVATVLANPGGGFAAFPVERRS